MSRGTVDAPGPDPVEDVERLAEIAAHDALSPDLRARLDAFAERAAERTGMPVGLVSVVLDTAQFFAGRHGLSGWLADAQGTPVAWSFCASAVRGGRPYVVRDAENDPDQRDNPLVVNDGIRSYAGVPLRTASGAVLGACCVIGDTPHDFTETDIAELEAIAADVMGELRRHAGQGEP